MRLPSGERIETGRYRQQEDAAMFDLIFWPALGTLFLARLACAVLSVMADDVRHPQE